MDKCNPLNKAPSYLIQSPHVLTPSSRVRDHSAINPASVINDNNDVKVYIILREPYRQSGLYNTQDTHPATHVKELTGQIMRSTSRKIPKRLKKVVRSLSGATSGSLASKRRRLKCGGAAMMATK